MISNHLSSIEGVAIYPIISLIIFFALFICLVVWVVKVDKSYLSAMSNLPLENENLNTKNSENENEIE